MKMFKIFALVVLLAVSVMPGLAQTTTTQTILSAAVTATDQRTITVASTTGFTASGASGQYFVYIDNELLQVQSVNTTTGVVGVTRGAGSTVATRHQLNAIVFFGQGGARWDPGSGNVTGTGPFITQTPIGPCTAASNSYLPVINTSNGPSGGDVSNCINTFSTSPGAAGQAGQWQTTNFHRYASNAGVTTVDDAAYTALLTDSLVIYSRVTSTRILTLPSISGLEGKRITVKSMGPSTSAITVTSVNGQSIGTHNGGMTASVACAGCSIRLVSFLQRAVGTNAWIWITE